MKCIAKLFCMILFLSFIISCNQKPDIETCKKEILELHKEMIDAHLNRDVAYFVKDISDDYFQVQRGEINYPAKEDITNRFSNYLNNTVFTKYEDIWDPIVGISEDGSLAWIVVQMKIEGSRMMPDGKEAELNFTCAWITLYKREGEKWIRMMEVDNYK